MNNVIFIMVDSMCAQNLGTCQTEVSSTPFIDTMIEKGLYLPNVWSYAPYTDAATKGLYCGQPVLSDYGYYFCINASEGNHYKWFKDNGFETYGSYYPYYLLSSNVVNSIDHSIYTGGFAYQSVWFGKLEYYAKKLMAGTLSESDCKLLEKCVDMVFDAWLTFYEDVFDEGSTFTAAYTRNSSLEGTGREGLLSEFLAYTASPKEYVLEMLSQGMMHPLARVNEYDFGMVANLQTLNYAYHTHKSFFKSLTNIELSKNLVNGHAKISRVFEGVGEFLKSRNRDDLRYAANCLMCFNYQKMERKRSLNGVWQYSPSMKTQVDMLLDEIKNRNIDKPFYFSLHTGEPHHNITFFSYDESNTSIIDEEIAYERDLLVGSGSGFKGNLDYQLALRYTDLCVKRLIDGLDAQGVLDTTTIVITADHGTSFFYAPIRKRVVNTFHSENYNIPLIVWSKNLPKEKRGIAKGMYTSADVFPTVFDCLGLEKQATMRGEIARVDSPGRPFVITEYMGPGCPDMQERDAWMSYRDEERIVACKQSMRDGFDASRVCDWYELRADPLELDNLANKRRADKDPHASECLGLIDERYREIRRETKDFLDALDSFETSDRR